MDGLSREGQVAIVAAAGPIDEVTVRVLADAAALAGEDGDVRVLVVEGEPALWEGWAGAIADRLGELGLIGDPFGPLAAVAQPTIAVLRGEVVDAGLELALCADIRVADDAATLGLPGIAGGAFPAAGGLQRLARAIGRSRATQLVLSGGTIDAGTALDWGLLSEVGADAGAAARALAARIAERGPIATRLAKEAVVRGLEMPLEQALRYETDLTILLQSTSDRDEGVRAFVEKRAPRFQGR